MEDKNIIGDEEYSFKGEEKLTYRDIVLKQFQKVVTNFSKEMIKGYSVKSYPMGGSGPAVMTRYVGDSRKELIQSTNVLHDILQPKFDKEIKEKSKEINLQIIESKKEDSFKNGNYKIILNKYRKLFQYICLFLDRQDWFVTGSLEE